VVRDLVAVGAGDGVAEFNVCVHGVLLAVRESG
jgi:hypothetical protein